MNTSQLPALAFLKGEIEDILEDGKITPSERVDLFKAIERVLPTEFRAEAKARRLHAQGLAETEDEERRPIWHEDPPTDAQLRYLADLGGDPRGIRTKGEASDAIDQLVSSSRSVTNRQMMVLRFWHFVEMSKNGKTAVSEWMDGFYASDPHHLVAWNYWKQKNGDVGTKGDPSVVPLGIGYEYLALVKQVLTPGWTERIRRFLVKALVVAVFILICVIWLKSAGFLANRSPIGDSPTSTKV